LSNPLSAAQAQNLGAGAAMLSELFPRTVWAPNRARGSHAQNFFSRDFPAYMKERLGYFRRSAHAGGKGAGFREG
jgi:hypothetical protein